MKSLKELVMSAGVLLGMRMEQQQALERLATGFPLAAKIIHSSADPAKATGRLDANATAGSYNWEGPGARRPHLTVLGMDTKAKRNARRGTK